MASLLNDPKHWRERAAECRKVAAESDPLVRRSMMQVVEEYEELAKRAEERILKSPPSSD
jgi:hypothetical protein